MNPNSYQIDERAGIHTLTLTQSKNENSHNTQFVIRRCASHQKSKGE